MQTGFAFTKFADHLTSIAELSGDDLDLLARMPSTIRNFNSHEEIRHRGEHPNECCLVLQGYTCWKDTDHSDGQITSIHVPGDVPDLYTTLSPRVEARLCALGPAVVAFVPHAFFHEISARSERMARALSLLTLADIACLRNWLVILGSCESLTRAAHLICEITVRLRAVGLARDYRFTSPFTQSDLAAICGISPVHANRTIQDLRRKGPLQWQSRMITITDWPALVRLAGFKPDYLRLRRPMLQHDCHLSEPLTADGMEMSSSTPLSAPATPL
jgi:CRP-like cAMP-binding protein